jgi:murein DD-endopeptidase MepM/ murein hydrolase activator NlpD
MASVAACAYVVSQKDSSTTSVAYTPGPKPPSSRRGQSRLNIGLPTANQLLFVAGGENGFFQPIEPQRPDSGKYGCVRIGRSGEDGSGFHEGIDIRCLQRDRRGEPTDAVVAIADGTVVYVNPLSGASNYGIYIVVKHRWHDAELYSLYAHLSAVAARINPGASVHKGQPLGTMGRTSTDFRGGIPKERAHVHLEIDVLTNPHFAAWALRRNKKPIEHGVFNGNNLLGLDAAAFLVAAHADPQFSVQRFLDAQPPAFTVYFDARDPFPFLIQNPWLFRIPRDDGSLNTDESLMAIPPPTVAFQVTFDHTGFPLRVIPRKSTELSEEQQRAVIQQRFLLAGVNEAELERRNCRGLVRKDGASWRLTTKGNDLMELLCFSP